MRTKKILKTIAALGTGVFMMGATILGASAQMGARTDISKFPYNAINANGDLVDTEIVIGDDAKPEDTMAMTHLAQVPWYQESGSTSGTTTYEGDILEIVELSADRADYVELTEQLSDATRIVDDSIAPLGMEDVTVSSLCHRFMTIGDTWALQAEAVENADNEAAEVVLTAANNAQYAAYTLDCGGDPILADQDAVSGDLDLDNFANFGDVVLASANGNAIEIVTSINSVEFDLEEGETKEFVIDGEQVDVEAVFIGQGRDAELLVNDERVSIGTGETKQLNSVIIAAVEFYVHEFAGGVFRGVFRLGGHTVTLSDPDITNADFGDVFVNDVQSDELEVQITGRDLGNQVEITNVVVTADAPDDIQMRAGTSGREDYPELGEFYDVINAVMFFEGYTSQPESGDGQWIYLRRGAGDDEVKLTGASPFNTAAGQAIDSLPLFNNNDGGPVNGSWGKEPGELLVWDGEEHPTDTTFIVNSGDSSVVVMFTEYDDDATNTRGEVEFDIIGEGKVETICDYNGGNTLCEGTLNTHGLEIDYAVPLPIVVGSETIQVDVDDNGTVGDVASGDDGILQLSDGNNLVLADATPGQVTLVMDPDGYGDHVTTDNTQMTWDMSTAGEVGDVTFVNAGAAWTGFVEKEEDSDINVAWGGYGQYFELDPDDNPDEVMIWLPKQQSRAEVKMVFGSLTGATQTQVGGDKRIIHVAPAAVVMASEAHDGVNKWFVGGPCANPAFAAALGNPENCLDGIEPGQAYWKTGDLGNGKSWNAWYGYTGADTLAIAIVARTWDQHAGELTGDEVLLETATGTITTIA